jgi:hypothetical protein
MEMDVFLPNHHRSRVVLPVIVGDPMALLGSVARNSLAGLFSASFIGTVSAVCVGATIIFFLNNPRSTADVSQKMPHVKDYTRQMQDCSGEADRVVQSIRHDYQSYNQVWTTCANQVYFLDVMEDFDIRREKLLRQELDERVILWMVVAITVSGVALAGLQLLASYRLASTGTAKLADVSSLTVEAGAEANKISIQSSVTGLLILVVSLAFFIVYVKWIYMITEVPIEKPQSLAGETAPPGKVIGYGGLGPSAAPEHPVGPVFRGASEAAISFVTE